GLGVHRWLEQLEAIPPVRLRAVHRRVGVAQELVGGRGVGARSERDADAAAERHLAALTKERFPKDAEDPPGDGGCGRFVRVLLEQDDELVATEPGHRARRW